MYQQIWIDFFLRKINIRVLFHRELMLDVDCRNRKNQRHHDAKDCIVGQSGDTM